MQTCRKAQLHHPRSKLHQQGGLHCFINAAARALATGKEKISSKQHGGLGRVMGGQRRGISERGKVKQRLA